MSPPLPAFTGSDYAIPSADGSELYRFDEHGRHLATADSHTAKTLESFAYDSRGHLTGITDLDGDNGPVIEVGLPYRTQMHYQPGGLMNSITSPAGSTAHMSWTSRGLLSTDTDADGVSKNYTRADRSGGRTVTTTTALGHTKTNNYDLLADGAVHRAITGYDGLTTTLDLRPDGSRTISDPTGAIATYSLGADPRFGMNAPLVSTAGLTTPGGRHLTTSATRQVTLANALDPLSLQTETETTTINGRSATATYTAAQRKLTVTSPAGRAASVTFDANGRPQTDHIDGVLDVSSSYDSHGRLSGVVQGARSESYTYDASGRPDTATDAAGRVTSFAWDAADRLTNLTLPDGRQIGYSYDADGNLTSITPPGRPSHSFTPTPAGRGQDATAPAAPGGGTGTHLHYDGDGQLVRVTRPDGQDIIVGHDGAGRVSTIIRPEGGAVTYHYSATSGQVASVDSPDGETVSYGYDGPLTTSSTFSGPVAGTVTAAYDDDMRLASLNVTGSAAVGYSYDADSLLTNVGSLGITRDPANGRVTATSLGAVTSSQSYNAYGELAGLTWSTSAGTLLGLDYTRDQLGRVTQATDGGTLGARTRTYTYDTAGRLTGADENGAPTLRVSYDDNSNPTSIQRGSALPVTASYDDQDRLLRYGNTTYTYDADGQLASATSAGQTTSYTFDGLGRLTKAVLPDGKTITYTLDAFGRRVARKVNGTTTAQYLYSGGLNPVAELDASGNLVSRFVYGEDPTTPEYLIRSGRTYRYITDQLGSVRALVDTADGTIAEKLDYDPTGLLTRDTQPGFQPFGYAGGLSDPDTQLWHYGARDYDPQTLRWVSKDPIGFGGGDSNLYGYTLEDAVNLRDPSGADVNLLPGSGDRPLTPDLPGASVPGVAVSPDVDPSSAPGFRCNDNCIPRVSLPTFTEASTFGCSQTTLNSEDGEQGDGPDITYDPSLDDKDDPYHRFPSFFDEDITSDSPDVTDKKHDPPYEEYHVPAHVNGESGNLEVGGHRQSDGSFHVTHHFFNPRV